MKSKKTLLRVRYLDDPNRDWITLEREKSAPDKEHQQIMAAIRWVAILLIVIFLCLLVSCEATSIIKELAKL